MAKPNVVTLMFTILAWLQERGGADIEEIAGHFGVSKHDVAFAVEVLGNAFYGDGMPDEEMGLDWYAYEEFGHVRFDDLNRVGTKLGLSDDETIAFVTGLVFLTYMLPQDMRESAYSAALKLLAARNLTLDFSKFVELEDEAIVERREVIQSALYYNHSVQFTYVNNGGVRSVRRIFPSRIKQAGRHWLVEGADLVKGERRSFRLDRMEELRSGVGLEKRPLPEQPSGEQVWIFIDSNGRAAAQGNAQIKTYRGRHRAVYEVFDEQWMVTQILLVAPWLEEISREDLLDKAKEKARNAIANRDSVRAYFDGLK
ncbi:MAG: WYL domain-containing protein [Actinomycetaceae bacterium]|nr:WYL domain-containing protein [Actinomycetaceae bacterium]